jgi:hypothetical protein
VGAIRGIWRWRHNPLRRTTDLVEAWAALVALLLMVVGAPLVGLFAGSAAHDSLSRTARQQLAARHRVAATVLDATAVVAPAAADSVRPGEQEGRRRVLASWTAPDGTARRAHTWTTLRDPAPGRTEPAGASPSGPTAAGSRSPAPSTPARSPSTRAWPVSARPS